VRSRRGRRSARGAGCWPGAQAAVTGDHYGEPVDQASHPPGRRQAGRLEEAGLVQPERGDPVQARRVLHQRDAMVLHRPHHRRPATPGRVPPRRLDGRPCRPAGRPRPGPAGSAPPADRSRPPARSRSAPTGWFPAAPDPLRQHSTHRMTADRQVACPDQASAMRGGSHVTARIANHGGRSLNGKLPFPVYQLGRDDLETIQVEQQRPRRTTLLTHLSCRRQTSAKLCEVPRSSRAPTSPSAVHPTTLHDEEPVMRSRTLHGEAYGVSGHSGTMKPLLSPRCRE
jgi:hypothetical protein